MPGKLFGSSGIRGIFGQDITPELGTRLGLAIGSTAKRAVVGWDVRTTSPILASAVASGLMSAGCEVGFAGMVPTPTLARAVSSFDAGVMVTASHNPPEYNGFKLWNPDGMAFDRAQSDEIELLLGEGVFPRADWKGIGSSRELSDPISNHIQSIVSKIGQVSARVVVDCGNGAASVLSPYLLREMGCDVTALNADADGAFPGRGSEPLEEKLDVLKKAVLSSGAALGLAHDGDADRVVAVDEKGNFLDGDVLLPIIAKREAKKSLVVPVDASMAIDEYMDGARVHRCRVGDVYVAEAIKKHGAEFGGEPSGTFIFPRETYCPDGIFAAARLVALASDTKLSELAASVPRYPMLKERIPYDVAKRSTVEGKILAALERLKPVELQTLDGARAVFADGWMLVRPSGTEPKVKIVVEGRTEKAAKEMFKLAKDAVMEAIS
ncbi:MAG: phosphoglucosamine mutase [Methanobacteriota archaeon]